MPDPTHARHAVLAALEMAARLPSLNEAARAEGRPAVGLGIGLNTGVVCVGDMGSDVRRSYTVMGDAVNLASRIEGLTRRYGVDILVGEATRAACGDDGIVWIEVDRVRVKGRRGPVTLFTPAAATAAERPGFADDWHLWQLALAAWRGQHWDEAAALAALLRAQSSSAPFPALAEQLAARAHDAEARVDAPGWDGATAFETK